MSEADVDQVGVLEKRMREWITLTTLKGNFLSEIKAMRDPVLLLRIDALTNEEPQTALARIEELVQGGDA
jgi:hypothetical protein